MREGSHVDAYMHFVWSTWNRQEWLTPDVASPIFRCIIAECHVLRTEVVALNGMVDHVHLLVKIPPTVTLANLAQRVKGASSHLVNHAVGREGFRWQDGYSAMSVSRWDLPKLIAYIENQAEHHRCGSEKPALEPPVPSAEADG
jgi:REP element-mobilizing transposase RayT